jgi:hypothetical protein
MMAIGTLWVVHTKHSFHARCGRGPATHPCPEGFGRAATTRLSGVMGHSPAAFKETDVTRAVRAVRKAGEPVAGVRFYRDGGFTVLVAEPGNSALIKLNDNEVEDWITKH